MSKQYAKEHSLDIPHYSCIEFPLKVNNVDRAIEMVGGKEAIIRSVQDEKTTPLELRFSKSHYEHPVNAKVNTHEQVLIKISVPKTELEKNGGNIQRTLKSIHDKEKKPIHITPIAIINKTFRFREMSDFQYQIQNNQFVRDIDESIHDLRYNNIKKLEFKQDLEPWAPEESGLFELPAPPRLSSIPLPFNYQYKKNAATVMKEGKLTTRNKHIKLHSIIIKWNDEIPIKPSRQLLNQLELFQKDKANVFSADVLQTLDYITKLFNDKPIWIRKHIEAILPVHLKQCLKYALPQVAYTFTKGPWRQAYIKFGVDPKSSSDYAKYQTENFRVPKFVQSVPKGFISEVPNGVSRIFKFDGEELPSSLLFQLENLTDSLVVELLKKGTFREECDFYDGWYDSLTMAKLRRLMRYKLRTLVEGGRLDETRVDYIINKLQIQDEKEDLQDQPEPEEELDFDEGEYDEEDYDLDITEANYEEILKYLERFNPRGAQELRALGNVIRQRDLDLD